MISNITLLALNNNLKKILAKKLSKQLDMFYVDIDDFIEYDLNGIKRVIDVAGLEYFNKIETQTLKRIYSYENTIITLSLNTLNKTMHKLFVKNKSVSIFIKVDFKFYKKYLKLESESKEIEEINVAVFNERNKLLSDFADLTVELNKKDEKNSIKLIIGAIEKYYKIWKEIYEGN